jgi:acetate kinase
MRELLEEDAENQDRRARLAIDMFCLRVKKYIGAYFVEMDGADAVIFSGGIGENSAIIREKICAGLETIGLALDHEANQKTKPGDLSIITKPDSQVKAYVIPTNEELLIARDTVRVVKNAPRRW